MFCYVYGVSLSTKLDICAYKKVINILDLSKEFAPDYILVVVLKKRVPKLSHILAKLFNLFLKECCFSDCWKVLSVIPALKNVGGRSIVKNYHPVSLLSVVSKVFEKLVTHRLVAHL